MNHCMIHLQGILGGMVEMFPIERLQLLCHFLPKEQPYHCCLIIKEPYSWAVGYCWLIGGGIMRRPHNWNAMERSEMERCHCEAGREVTDRCLIMEINFPLISIDTKARILNKQTKMKTF